MPSDRFGVRRALSRLRPARPNASDVPRKRRDAAHPATRFDRVRAVRVSDPATVAAAAGRLRAEAGTRLTRLSGRDRALPVAIAGLVLVASVLSVAPVTGTLSSVPASTPRIALGGGVLGPQSLDDVGGIGVGEVADLTGGDLTAEAQSAEHLGAEFVPEASTAPMSRILADGTLLKPIVVDTSVPDASERLQTYQVKAGDTLTGIADKFGVSMMTIWWANHLKDKADLKQGQKLVIPPVDGLVVTAKEGDTVDSIAAAHKADAAKITAYNGLTDNELVIGQVIIVPGALGAAIATPTPKPTPKATARPRTTSSGGGAVSQPRSYSGGRFAWPMPGHRIIQYFNSGHRGLDIGASYGDRVYSAAAGTVVYAGWKNNGGGYVVWISHGSGLYTTYNHLQRVLVARGQSVGRGQVVGAAGATGWAYGPHLHFEVTRGYPWADGRDNRVNPLLYY